MTDQLITLEAIEAKQTELASLIAKFKRQPAAGPVLHKFGEIEIELHPGERYAGMVLDQGGKLLHHLVLMAQRHDGKLEWQEAMEWATSVGGVLPNRQEQALLYANCTPHLKPEWHWSSETHADDASFAWGCDFLYSYQLNLRKSYDGCAAAVRLVKPGVDVHPATYRDYARAIIAAHTEKLLAGMKFPCHPEPHTYRWSRLEEEVIKQYAAAAALKARRVEPKVERKVMSKAFCNPASPDWRDDVQASDYFNE